MLKASARVYTIGDVIGMTGRAVYNIDVLKNAIKSNKVPLVSSFEGQWTDPCAVIGHAELRVDGDSLYVDMTFNEASSDIYKKAFESDCNLKTGFYATNCKFNDKKIVGEVTSMEIRSIALGANCSGGKVDEYHEE